MAVMDLGKVVPEKGVDYFTEADVNQIVDATVQEAKSELKVSDFTNDAGYINKNVNDLTYYTLATSTGSTIELTLNNATYEMTLNLKDSAGTTISTDSVDLPLETMVVGATYDNTNKKIVLTLKNGTALDVPVGDLVNGLQAEITSTNKLSADLVDDSLGTNKFVTTAEKTAWNGKQDELTAGDNITINNNVISAVGGTDIYKITTYSFDLLGLKKGTYIFNNKNVSSLSINIYYSPTRTGTSVYSLSLSNGVMYVLKDITNDLEVGTDILAFCTTTSGTERMYTVSVANSSTGIATNSIEGNTYVMTTTQQIINGKKTFTTLPESSVTPTTNNQLVNKKYVDANKGQTIQYDTMPTADGTTVGKIVQYTGATDNTYTNGYFYVGTTDGGDPATYGWENINVQEGVTNLKTIDGESLLGSGNIQTSHVINITNAILELSDDINNKFFTDLVNNNLFETNKKDFFINSTTLGFCAAYISSVSPLSNYVLVSIQLSGICDKSSSSYYGISYSPMGKTNFSLYLKVNEYNNQKIEAVYTDQYFTKGRKTIGSGNKYALNNMTSILGMSNTTAYTPTGDYNPATKKYVDDSIASAITDALGGSY